MQTVDDIIFESRDVEIFNIPDTKTKLNTLQNYFFPRLQRLLDMALLLVKEIYKIDPLEKYTFVYRPSHRKNSKANWDTYNVHIGIAGRRKLGRELKIKKADGSSYALHPSYLLLRIMPTGEMFIELSPFYLLVNEDYIRCVKRFLAKNYRVFSILLDAGKIYYEDEDPFSSVATKLKGKYGFKSYFSSWFRDEHPFKLSSAKHYFPINNQSAINDLVKSFVFMFPILNACYDIAEGTTPVFSNHFDNLKSWSIKSKDQEHGEVRRNETIPQLPELDSYKFVRAGLWYQVLMKDNWTCCSCKRSAKEHGIVLHVDHKLPRSRGGKDEIENLQTLCLKCNIGKSNKDTTDLRA